MIENVTGWYELMYPGFWKQALAGAVVMFGAAFVWAWFQQSDFSNAPEENDV